MSGTHISVSLGDGISGVSGSVFTVHVVGSRSWVVSEPDSEVLDNGWWLFLNLLDRDNFTSGLVDLLVVWYKVPESWLGSDWVWCEKSNPVEWWVWLSVFLEDWLIWTGGRTNVLDTTTLTIEPWVSSKIWLRQIQSWWQFTASDQEFAKITFALHFSRSLKKSKNYHSGRRKISRAKYDKGSTRSNMFQTITLRFTPVSF